MKSFGKELIIILTFAILHVVMTVIARWQGLSDHLMLTTLTMLMAVTLCQIKRSNVATMIIILVIVNFGGFYLSRCIGRFLHTFITNTYIRGGTATFTTTFLMGLAVCGIVSLINKRKSAERKQKQLSTYWLLLVFTVIIVARLALILISGESLYEGNATLNVIIDYTFCCVALFYLAISAIKEGRKAQDAKEKYNIAQYSYLRLQQQVKPHFMFNNLSILNSLICDGQIPEASDFVYKLAYLYRYLIENEEETAGKFVVPCSIQLLVENAIKHNGSTVQTPLKIRIYNTSTHIIVNNNRLKKNTCESSTHLGLKYIRQIYGDLTSKEVKIESTDEEFTVKLPIIN